MARLLPATSAFVATAVTLAGCGKGDEDSGSGYSPGSVGAAWNNHFVAFGGKDLDKIMLDYDAGSTVWLFDDKCGKTEAAGDPPPAKTVGLTKYNGKDAIRAMFDGLFKRLTPGEVTKVGPWRREPTVMEGDGQKGNVFLTWRTTGLTGKDKLDFATDTFTFQTNRKIAQQNIVVTQPDPLATCSEGEDKSAPFCGNFVDGTDIKAGICRAWWGSKVVLPPAVPTDGQGSMLATLQPLEIIKSYTESSIVQLYDTTTEVYIYFEGIKAIVQMHADMIRVIELFGGTDFPYGIQQQLLEVNEATNTVMFVFHCAAYQRATMTYTFAKEGDMPKIVRMNMVITTAGQRSALTEIQV